VVSKHAKWLVFLLVCLVAAPAAAQVRLPALFADHMVLQQGKPAPVWGWAAPGEQVTVRLGDRQAAATADASGRWLAQLPPLAAGGPHELTVQASNTITRHDVLVGEVWIASGQSNMEWPLRRAANADQEIAQADYPLIRCFTVTKAVAPEPQAECQGEWVICSPDTADDFSAVGYFFVRELHQRLGVPVGLINSSWGGTPAESWTSRAALLADPELAYLVGNWDQAMAKYTEDCLLPAAQVRDWLARAEAARTAGQPLPQPPPSAWPDDPRRNPWLAGGLYNGMIAPLVPYALAGAIWYQGESNAGRAYQYRRLFPALIQDWRRAWGQGEFPFLFVQLANFMPARPEPGDSAWAELREAQLLTLALPTTGMAVIIDIGDAADIHPANKQDVGRRLALAAQALAYRQRVAYSGPIYRALTVEGDRLRLHFRHTGGKLVARGGPLQGFAIAGEDRFFVWAQARIEGNTVVVWSPQVPRPVAVRYAWADNPVCNLYHQGGLPASPFRTDDWPGLTLGKQ